MGLATTPSFARAANLDLGLEDETGIQTVPELIEHNALRNPHHCFCIQAQKQVQDATGLRLLSISHLQLKRAIARCQAWLVNVVDKVQLPSSSHDGRVSKGLPVALFVESDVGLLIHLFASIALGVPVRLRPGQCPRLVD